MSQQEEIRYTDRCGSCGTEWVRRPKDYQIESGLGDQATVKCRCGATWGMTARLARHL